MQELRRICDKYGILLVADEVQSGAGRTGKWWAIEHTGVQPDIVCMAKGIASGMPLGIMMSRADIMDWVPGSHASTFGGNPVCIAAALATLDVIEKEGLLANSAEVGNHMLKRMADWPRKHKLVGDVRGPRADDRRRNRQGQEDQGVRARSCATASSNWPSSAAFCSWAAGRARSASRRRWSSPRTKPTSQSMCWKSASPWPAISLCGRGRPRPRLLTFSAIGRK